MSRVPDYPNHLGKPWYLFVTEEIIMHKNHNILIDPGEFERIWPLLADYSLRDLPASQRYRLFPIYEEQIRKNFPAAVKYCEETLGIHVYKVPKENSTIIQIITIDPNYEDAHRRCLRGAARRAIIYGWAMLDKGKYPELQDMEINKVANVYSLLQGVIQRCGADAVQMDMLRGQLEQIFDDPEEIERLTEIVEWYRDGFKSLQLQAKNGSEDLLSGHTP